MPDQLPTLLRMVRREPDPEPGHDEPDTSPIDAQEGATVRVLPLEGAQMSWLDQVNAAAVHAFRAAWLNARQTARRDGGMIHGLLGSKPPSVTEQCEYAKSRAWVPPGHDGGIAETAGVIYHALIGRPGVALGNLISGTAARPLRAFLAVVILLVITLVVIFAF